VLFLLLGPCIFSLFLPGAPAADPVPDGWFYVHVHQGTELINDCSEVQQYTEETGELTFDVYFWPMAAFEEYFHVGLELVDLGVFFSPDWTVISAEAAPGAEGTLEPWNNYDYHVVLSWSECPTQNHNHQLFWVARFVVDVTSEGYCNPYNAAYELCYPEHGWTNIAAKISAQAGAGWAHCEMPCGQDERYVCMHPDQVWLSVYEGGTTQDEIEIHCTAQEVSPGWLIHESTVDYVTVEEVYGGPEGIQLTVTVDASDLAPGLHESWVRTTIPDQDCREHAFVRLTVLPSTPTEKVSWGLLKGLYRE